MNRFRPDKSELWNKSNEFFETTLVHVNPDTSFWSFVNDLVCYRVGDNRMPKIKAEMQGYHFHDMSSALVKESARYFKPEPALRIIPEVSMENFLSMFTGRVFLVRYENTYRHGGKASIWTYCPVFENPEDLTLWSMFCEAHKEADSWFMLNATPNQDKTIVDIDLYNKELAR